MSPPTNEAPAATWTCPGSATVSWKRTDHRAMDGHDPKRATFRALPSAREGMAQRQDQIHRQRRETIRGLAPWRHDEPGQINGRYLDLDERIGIANMLRAGMGVRTIVADMGRSASTVNRKLRWNTDTGSTTTSPGRC